MRPARRRSRVRRTLPGQLSVLLSLLSLLIAWSLTNLTPMARADGRSPLLCGSEAGPAPIVLDGRTLFRIWPSGNLSAEQRSAAINQRLAEAAAGETTAAIEVGTQNNLPVLLLNGRTLLTVTERDVPEGLEAMEQAKAWRQGLEAALTRARAKRSPGHLRRILPWVLAVLAAAAVLHWGLRAVWHGRFPQAWALQPDEHLERHSRSVRFLQRAALVLLQAAVLSPAALDNHSMGTVFEELVRRFNEDNNE
jgi:hypothetical protein